MNESELVDAIKKFVDAHKSEKPDSLKITIIDAAQEFDCESQLKTFLSWFPKS